jgi:hypothetical protein
MNQDIVLIVSSQVVAKNSKINWPDLNYPNTNQTILRTLHDVDYKNLTIRLDSADGPVFDAYHFPTGVGFYQKIKKTV